MVRRAETKRKREGVAQESPEINEQQKNEIMTKRTKGGVWRRLDKRILGNYVPASWVEANSLVMSPACSKIREKTVCLMS